MPVQRDRTASTFDWGYRCQKASYNASMQFETTIDRFGRIVLPKELRDELGLEPGAVLAVEEQGQDILLKPRRDEAGLVRKGPVLVYTGKARGDLAAAVRSVREGRMRRLRKGVGK